MGNSLRNCVSSPEDNQGSHTSLLRENSDQRNQQQRGLGRSNVSQAQQQQRYFLSPDSSRRVEELTEDEQVKIAKRIGLIGYLPIRFFIERDKDEERECVICMVEYENGDELRYLPCTHSFHKTCIDTWLMRSFTCPNCSQQVDSALVGSFDPLGGGSGGAAAAATSSVVEEVELQQPQSKEQQLNSPED